MRFALRMLVSAMTIFGVAYISRGSLIVVDTFVAALIAAVALAFVNAFVKPVVSVISFPVTVITLGLFALVINALMFYLVAAVVPGVHTVGFFRTVLASLIIAAVTSVLTRLVESD
ncbi:MAG: phage holin family protein [Coriobacteriia bacterium]